MPPPPQVPRRNPLVCSFCEKRQKFVIFLQIYTICHTTLHLIALKYSKPCQRGRWGLGRGGTPPLIPLRQDGDEKERLAPS